MKCQELSGHVRLITIILISVNIIWFSLVFALIMRKNENRSKTLGQEEHIIIDGI